MYVSLCLFLIVVSEATGDYDDEAPSPIQKKTDVYPEHFPLPVPFGHIPMEGFGDPLMPGKQPIDPLELDMVEPKNPQDAEQLLKKGRKYVQFMKPTIPKGFANPRDMYLSEIVHPPSENNETQLKWYNLAEIQMRNAMMPPVRKHVPNRRGPAQVNPDVTSDPKKPYFIKNTFQLKDQDRILQKINWTTCDQFAVGAIFSPKDIVNYDWVPFFIWSINTYRTAIVHKFTYPTKKLVNEYYVSYKKYLNKTIDWTQTKLLMRGMNEMLLIAADRRGLFHAIAKHEIPEAVKDQSVTLPSLTIRLKIEDPYLVMTFCEDYIAMAMAISGNEPTNYKDMKAEAATIKFVGIGRPVWRNYEEEKETARLEKERKIEEENDKIIRLDGDLPPINIFEPSK